MLLTGTLMALPWFLLLMRRPKYSSLQTPHALRRRYWSWRQAEGQRCFTERLHVLHLWLEQPFMRGAIELDAEAYLVLSLKLPLQCQSLPRLTTGRITTSLGRSASSQWIAALLATPPSLMLCAMRFKQQAA